MRHVCPGQTSTTYHGGVIRWHSLDNAAVVDPLESEAVPMHFSGTVYFGDKSVAMDVLGAYSGKNGNLAGFFVLTVGQDVPIGSYTLLTDGGQVQDIVVVYSVGEPHQPKLVQFVSAKTVQGFVKQQTVLTAASHQMR